MITIFFLYHFFVCCLQAYNADIIFQCRNGELFVAAVGAVASIRHHRVLVNGIYKSNSNIGFLLLILMLAFSITYQ